MNDFDRDTITRLRAGETTDHGNVVPDWGAPDSLTITGCDVQPGASQEDLANRDGVLIRWTVYGPYDADVNARDRVVWDGATYEVDGNPARWQGLGLDHTVILLKDWDG